MNSVSYYIIHLNGLYISNACLYFLFKEKLFLEKLNNNHECSLRRLSDSHREKIALMDRQFLQQKQQVCL